jgi:transcriptional regulator with XRE-family HTH domain
MTHDVELKMLALRQRMKERGVTEAHLAARIGLRSRDAVTGWRAGKFWPRTPTETLLEIALEVPQGFFAAIAAGTAYDDALAMSHPVSEILSPAQQVDILMRADPTQLAGPFTIRDIQNHLRTQIEMFFKIAMPNGAGTGEGLTRARAVVQTKDLSPLRTQARRKED